MSKNNYNDKDKRDAVQAIKNFFDQIETDANAPLPLAQFRDLLADSYYKEDKKLITQLMKYDPNWGERAIRAASADTGLEQDAIDQIVALLLTFEESFALGKERIVCEKPTEEVFTGIPKLSIGIYPQDNSWIFLELQEASGQAPHKGFGIEQARNGETKEAAAVVIMTVTKITGYKEALVTFVPNINKGKLSIYTKTGTGGGDTHGEKLSMFMVHNFLIDQGVEPKSAKITTCVNVVKSTGNGVSSVCGGCKGMFKSFEKQFDYSLVQFTDIGNNKTTPDLIIKNVLHQDR